MSESRPAALKEILAAFKHPITEKETLLISRAYILAEEAHRGHQRKSGQPYIIHPVAVAVLLAELGADSETVAAALLHDTVEDAGFDLAVIEKEFGTTVAFLVDGVTKLGKLKYQGIARHAESLRKLFVAMAEDIRVIFIRLADRLHNVKTLEHVDKNKRERIALETLEIYAPLANRLGIWRLKGMLEDASFPYAYPAAYQQVVTIRKTKGKESIKRLEKVYRTLGKTMTEKGLTDFTIDYRIKYLYSLYQKLLRKNMDIDEIYDISALRVIVDNIEQCYQVLGIIHNLWKPVPRRIKDYIANPKPNGYRSIHTAVFTGDGRMVEIQIRTKAMQREAEYGLASHLLYDESNKMSGSGQRKKLPKNDQWIKELIEWQKEVKESAEFLHTLKSDFFHDRIFVFTPDGDVVELPKGATILDFAYAIHSDIGHHADGAWMNGKYVSLNTVLENRSTVRVETKKNNHPSVKWLDIVKTSLAKRYIRNALHLTKRKGVGAYIEKFFMK